MPIEEFEEACVSLEKFIELTKVEDPKKRRLALRDLCPVRLESFSSINRSVSR
jgi:hypothetical protein